ncbi:hypothetical protein ACFQ0M_09825 [Kitasatospora aburaviensis]
MRTYTSAPGRPNTLVAVDQTGPAGTLKETYSYDATGNTTGRTIGSAPPRPWSGTSRAGWPS